MSIIQQLKREGVLELWINPKRHFRDISGKNIAMTNSASSFTGQGIQFLTNTDNITAADSAGLQSTTGCMHVHGAFRSQIGTETYLNKQDGGSRQYRIQATSTNLVFVDTGGLSRTRAMTFDGAHSFSVNHADGTTPDMYQDGTLVGAASGNTTITANLADLVIGSQFGGGGRTRTVLYDIIICSRQLTADEISTLDEALVALRYLFDSRPWEITGGTKWVQRKGITESVATIGAGETLGNSGFRVQSGSFKIVHGIIDSVLMPAIECITDGVVYIPTSRFRQTSAQAAYGSWNWKQYKPDAEIIDVAFGIGIGTGVGTYRVESNIGEVLTFKESGVATHITSAIAITPDVWQDLALTRPGSNLFELFLESLSVGTATDSTITTAPYLSFGLTTGCKIAGFSKGIA